MDSKIKIALVDDHIVVRAGLAILIDSFEDCKVIHQSGTGKELIRNLKVGILPDIVILDLSMPEMDGFDTAEWLRQNYPQIHILMLTVFDSELSLIRLLQQGVKGFLKKDIHPSEFKYAINSVVRSGYYYSSSTTGRLVNLFRNKKDESNKLQQSMLATHEIRFLKLACTDLTYKEIAQKMAVNPRTIDTIRDQLFIKLDVRSRVGLAMVAIKHGIVTF